MNLKKITGLDVYRVVSIFSLNIVVSFVVLKKKN